MFRIFFNKRGAALTEYAVLLAFVAAIGVSFASDNGLAASIKDTISRVEKVLGAEVGDLPGGGNGGSSEEGNGGGETPSDGGGSNEDNKTDDNENENNNNNNGSGDKTEDNTDNGSTGGGGSGDVGFAIEDEEEKYGQLVNDLIDYLFDSYDKEGYELTGAQITGNANGLTLTYKDAQGNTHTDTISSIDIMDALSKKYNCAYDYNVKTATLNFENKKLVAGAENTTVIKAWPSGKGGGQGSKKETLTFNEEGKLQVQK